MSFLEDRVYGKKGELLVARILGAAGIPTRMLDTKTKDFDFFLGGWYRVEVKSDRKERFTGNVAVEYYNCKQGKPSGLSITTADIWAFCISTGVWVTDVPSLRRHFHTMPYLRDVPRAGDGNAVIRLYDRRDLFARLFFRIDDATPEALVSYLNTLLGKTPCSHCVSPEPLWRSNSSPASSSTRPMSTSQPGARYYSRAA